MNDNNVYENPSGQHNIYLFQVSSPELQKSRHSGHISF